MADALYFREPWTEKVRKMSVNLEERKILCDEPLELPATTSAQHKQETPQSAASPEFEASKTTYPLKKKKRNQLPQTW